MVGSRIRAVGCALGLLLALAACAADPSGGPVLAEKRQPSLNDTADCHDQARWQAEQHYPTRTQGIRNRIETTNELGRFSEEVQLFKRCLQHKAYWP
jgi:hypothetical protein